MDILMNPGDLPVDADELIAMCAPRPTFISYGASSGPGAEGTWVDQKGSFMAAVAAGPVYRLLGKKDLGTSEFPPVETALTDGRSEEHTSELQSHLNLVCRLLLEKKKA